MTAVSTLPVAKAHIVSKIKSLTGFQPTTATGVAVSYGHPGNALEREHVWITGTSPFGQEWGPFGQRAKNETYSLKGYVLVSMPGDSQQAATERAFVIFSAIELAFRTSSEITLSGSPGVISCIVQPTGLFEGQVPEGHQALIEFDLNVSARI